MSWGHRRWLGMLKNTRCFYSNIFEEGERTKEKGDSPSSKESYPILETGTAYELTHNARGRYFFVTDRQEVMDELQQAVGLRILWAILCNGREDELGMGTEHGKLNVEG